MNTLSGNLFLSRTDIYIPARGFDMDISFSYNSFLFTEEFGYGKGWSFNYNIRYSHDTTPGARLLFWGDGREDKYDSIPGGGYRSPRGFFDTLMQYQPGKYVLRKLNGVKYFFDNPVHRRITRMEEPNSNYISFTYSDSLLTAITNAAGQTVTFTYNPQGRLASVIDAVASPSRTFTYTYDASGNLREVKDPLNGTWQYTYLVNGPIKSTADENNNKVDIIYFPDLTIRELIGCNKRLSFSYDTTAQTTIVTDHLETGNQVTKYTYKTVDNFSWITSVSGNCCGFNMSYEYDDEGNQIKMTDANGQVYTYTYDANGNMLTATDPLNQTRFYTYTTDFNKVSSFKDPNGNLYTLQYDAKGNLTQLTTPDNQIYTAAYNASGDIITSTDPKGNRYTYNYDNYGNPVNVTGPNGYKANLSFDARGRLLSYTDANGNTANAEYDILNRLKKITDPFNQVVQLAYDAAGNIITLVNKNNEITRFNYDAGNRLVKVTGPTGNQVSFAYDGMDNLLSVRNALGHPVNYSYDNRNRLREVRDPENNGTVYSYDDNGNVIGVNLPNGQSFNYTYDRLNRLLSVRDATSTIATYTYDKNGNVTSYTNATGAVVRATYDNLDRIRQITDPLGHSTSFAYDKNNNIVAVTDREGKTSQYTYDSLNRVKTYTDNNGFVITVGYDAMDNITSLTDQNGNVTTYTYDQLNRRKRMIYPDGTYLEYNYDKESNVTTLRRTDGSVVTFQYDTLNRVTARILPDGEVYSYTYDQVDRVLTATNGNGTVAFTYDALNRVTSETFDGRTTRYAYSIAGRTQTTIYPDSTVVLKEFDTRNRLIRIARNNVTVAEYAYNNFNQLTQRRFANGLATILQYDFANRLTSMTTGSFQNTTFTYDKMRNKTAIIRPGNPSLSEEFTYDNGYRLTQYKRGPAGSPVVQNTYTYDAVGNRTAANLNGAATTYTINNLNQVRAVNGTAFTFDQRGNLTYDGKFYKTYDAENRLVKDSSSPSSVITYGYDAIGRRVVKNSNGTLLKYTYSGVAQIEERDGSNNLLNRTVFTNFLSPVLNENSGNLFYYHPNELGSVEAITNSNGGVVETYRYDVYGKLSRYDSVNNPLPASLAGNRFGFTGQEYDSASGSYRFFYRNYSPETGVFNQRDLIEYEDGMGMYQYVGNNPANGVDVWGLAGDYESFNPEIGPQAACQVNVSKMNRNVWSDIQEVNDFATNASFSWSTGNSIGQAVNTGSIDVPQSINKPGGGIGGAGTVFSFTDLGIKGANNYTVQTSATSTYFERVDANYDVVGSGGGLLAGLGSAAVGGPIGLGIGIGTGVLAGADYASTKITKKNIRQHTEAPIVRKFQKNSSSEGFYEFINHNFNSRYFSREDWIEARALWDEDRAIEFVIKKRGYRLDYDSYNNSQCNEGGTRKRGKWIWDYEKQMFVFEPFDPNEILGPEGQPDKAWVSVKDRLPYTILFENDSTATARARYVRIITPIEPKQDPATLELGSVGFNNQSFDLPKGRSSYYQRLDARDSTGVFVDITAGYDVINNLVFWEFQSIDPLTLMPPEDPLAGFLFLRDTANPAYGNGFVNFSIKPRTNAKTLDTIGARASIIFDENQAILTNIHTNTIDALPPSSRFTAITVSGTNPITLSWTGADDTNGSGIDFYSIYVSTDQVNYSVLIPRISRTDTAINLPADGNYCFFVLATDRVGNMETLQPGMIQCASIVTNVPGNLFYFNGTNEGKNNILTWGTTREENSKEFILERSLNGSVFTPIATLPAAGTSFAPRNYQFTDYNIDQLKSAVMYYRVKQVDVFNDYKYSNVVRLNYGRISTKASIVYPNPTNGIVNILIGNRTLLGKEAIITDVNGRVIRKLLITAENQQVDLSMFTNGIYFIRLRNNEVLKVMKQ
ncbi:MAG TPA: RHS repeat-associated core domain-containing protein [Lacibacter sp.]|nr:RHS repeat-associated core domain-containing protein [Lacibacter sp.]HMO88569.1 RHS repeat-associated core domain-containing protein [Lacibacter sp.]